MKKIKDNKALSFAYVTLVYALATVIGVISFRLFDLHFAWSLLIADVIATVFVFIFSVIARNASVYDPYWSVQPIIILLYCMLHLNLNAVTVVLFAVVFLWGVRLTANWAYCFGDLTHQDWRYTMLAEKTGKAYPIVNFVGIHLVPTLVVYACVLPCVVVFTEEVTFNAWVVVGALLSVTGTMLELVADIEMQRYRKNRTTPFNRNGLWKYSRHPNYLGEIIMWWGVAISCVGVLPSKPWLFAGAFLNTLLFAFVSIPMAEKRQARKEGFAEYKMATHLLLPFKK